LQIWNIKGDSLKDFKKLVKITDDVVFTEDINGIFKFFRNELN